MSSRGLVEQAVRARVPRGTRLRTPSQGAPFTVAEVDDKGVVLLLGKQEARTPFTWSCLDGIVELLAGGNWVPIGGVYDTEGQPGTLDGYLKGWIKRATAGWVAALLESAGVVEIDRDRPARVRLIPPG